MGFFKRNREVLIPPNQRTKFVEEAANPPETYDQMLIRLAREATKPAEIKPLIKQAKSNKGGPWRQTVKTLESIKRDKEETRRHIRSGWTRARVNLDSGYEPPTVDHEPARTRVFDPDTDIHMDILTDTDREFAKGHGQRDWERRSSCTSEWGSGTHPRERSIVPD